MTNIQFTNDEETLLNKGNKYNIVPAPNKNLKQLIIETENAVQHINDNQKEAIRYLAAQNIRTIMSKQHTINKHYKQQAHTANSIKKKLHEHNATITEADKGNSLVILYKQTLDEKVAQFLNDNQIETLRSDPTAKMQKQIQDTLRQCKTIIDQNKKKYVIQMNPQAPILKAKIKLHKPMAPIRPVVNNIQAPSYKLAKLTHQKLKEHLALKNEFNYINSITLANDICKLSTVKSVQCSKCSGRWRQVAGFALQLLCVDSMCSTRCS
jgi:hypothetical protein